MEAAVMIGEKKLLLKSSDGELFQVEESTVAMQSQLIRDTIAAARAENGAVIPIHDVDAAVLSKVLSFCNKHAKASLPADAEDLKNFDQGLVNANYAALFDLIFAAHCMGLRGLMDLACQSVADAIEAQFPEEVRRSFYCDNQQMFK